MIKRVNRYEPTYCRLILLSGVHDHAFRSPGRVERRISRWRRQTTVTSCLQSIGSLRDPHADSALEVCQVKVLCTVPMRATAVIELIAGSKVAEQARLLQERVTEVHKELRK